MRFATTFCDLKKRRVFDVAPGHSNAALSPYLSDLAGKSRVRVICMDLSESYRSIARTWFPHALIVADRFHVVRLALHRLMKTCRSIDPDLVGKRGMVRLLQKHEPQSNRSTSRPSLRVSRKPSRHCQHLRVQGKADGVADGEK